MSTKPLSEGQKLETQATGLRRGGDRDWATSKTMPSKRWEGKVRSGAFSGKKKGEEGAIDDRRKGGKNFRQWPAGEREGRKKTQTHPN